MVKFRRMSRIQTLGFPLLTAIGATLAASPSQAGLVYDLYPGSGNLTNQAYVEGYFNGGYDSYGTNAGGRDPAGPSDNVIFAPLQSTTLQTDFLINQNEVQYNKIPSVIAGQNPHDAVLFQSVTSVMNLATGYELTGLSFDFSIYKNSASYATNVEIWSGLNGTGTLLQTINLAAPGGSTACTSTYYFCSWSAVTANFSGDAKSVTFGNWNGSSIGTGTNEIGEAAFDSIQVTETPVPLPAASWLLLSGFGGFGVLARKRRVH